VHPDRPGLQGQQEVWEVLVLREVLEQQEELVHQAQPEQPDPPVLREMQVLMARLGLPVPLVRKEVQGLLDPPELPEVSV